MKGRGPVVLARFLSMGAVNTLIGLGVIYACKRLFGFGDILANASGYAVGLTIGFMLNKHWTFGHTGNARVAALRFLAVFGVAYSVNLLCVLFAIRPQVSTTMSLRPSGSYPIRRSSISVVASMHFAADIGSPDANALEQHADLGPFTPPSVCALGCLSGVVARWYSVACVGPAFSALPHRGCRASP